jgi:hypothetical protein
MAVMAASQPLSDERPVISVRSRGTTGAWLLWIGACVVAAVVGAVTAGEIRSLLPEAVTKDGAYLATVINVLILSGVQWLVLRRYRLDADWWVPATVAANLVTAIVVIPTMLNLFAPTTGHPMTIGMAIASGAITLATAGLIVGVAQAVVLRLSAGGVALLWIPATVLGGALAGALTTALAAQLFGLPALVTIGLVAATGSLMNAAAQAPVLLRVIR